MHQCVWNIEIQDSADMVSELNNRIIEKVAENYEEGNISALDIVIVRIDFGSFSQDNASEIFVLCKILNTPSCCRIG